MLNREIYEPSRPGVRVVRSGLVIDETGLSLCAGPPLARMAKGGKLELADDRERVVALLSVAYRRPADATLFEHIEAAADHWNRGDKALANLRLLFAGLPRVDEPAEMARVRSAEWLLDQGLAPRVLMKELGLDPAALELEKYDPDQPRVPAGHGQESGRWEGNEGRSDTTRPHDDIKAKAGPHRVQVAANGPLTPGGIIAVPSPEIDPLDPMELNKEPPTPQEQQAIVDTLKTIQSGNAAEIKRLNPHPYRNLPHYATGATLPSAIGNYLSYNVRSFGGRDRGTSRLLLDSAVDGAYYTNNHYLSFYKVDVNVNHGRK